MSKKWSNYLNSYYENFEVCGIKINYFQKKTNSLQMSVNFWVGSKDYYVANNKSGIAHFVEHVLFNNKHATNIQDLMNEGVNINGFTSTAGTAYYIGSNKQQVFDDNLIEKLFDLTFSLNVDEDTVINERGIIASEASENITNPVSKFYETIGKKFFKNTGLEKDIIGTIEDITSTTFEDVINFYNDFYCHDNMELTLVGDLSKQELELIFKMIENQKEKTKNHLSNVFNNKFNIKKNILRTLI